MENKIIEETEYFIITKEDQTYKVIIKLRKIKDECYIKSSKLELIKTKDKQLIDRIITTLENIYNQGFEDGYNECYEEEY